MTGAEPLSPPARALLDALAAPRSENPFPDGPPDLGRIGDGELGALVPDAYAGENYSAKNLIREAVAAREVTFSPHTCERVFAALAERGTRGVGGAHIGLGLGVLLRCTGPWPDGLSETARPIVRYLIDKPDMLRRAPYALLGTAILAGPDLHGEVLERLASHYGPIGLDEMRWLEDWGVEGFAVMSEFFDDFYVTWLAPRRDAARRLLDKGRLAVARKALEKAGARLADIQAGRIPFAADKAFTAHEVAVLGRGARLALERDEPWLPELLDRMLHAVAVAPTAARTLPSQALLFELARAAEEVPTPELVTSLRAVRRIVRHAGVAKQLDRKWKRIDAALAERADVAFRLPDLGFGPDGVLRTPLGEYEAVVTVAASVELTWNGPGGKPLKSVPAAVRRDHGDTIKELRELVKRVRAHVTTLARVLEGGLPGEIAMPYGEWRDRLGSHPIAATLVRSLIWEAETAAGEWRPWLPATGDGAPGGGAPGGWALDDAAPVRLWHPIRSTPDEVRAWRDLLVERRIAQPFKQAFREIYVLTPAEVATGVYSNRYAAHILRYRQLFALLRGRGWKSDMLGPWDGGHESVAYRTLASGEWRAAFHHDYVESMDERELCSTDQVRLARREGLGWRDAPLTEVPAVVFSEAMRDVDLFVGVTSIATDPEWADRGEDGHIDYWRRESVGDLTATAEVRRDALARILPRTKIADRCSIVGRFLAVRGDLATYKIHLGSGNILMEPDDAYLCIVSARSGGGTVFLPFEDERLSLILSKALLLAADAKIDDPSILSQIKRGA
ncbi:DUF4132 domain-containing protein [Actinomadura sp. 9N407]|uniref:DUF4132 domain-containing protein n=1 Tax=Actinomadura sp. 9N407 TaxID=3375154 RepID=UPI00379A6FE9